MNKLLLLATILVSFLLKDYAAASPLGKATTQTDTTDTNQLLRGNPKEGFKNLFDESSESDFHLGRLNPKAIAFIKDYMDKEGDNLERLKISGTKRSRSISNV